MEKVKVRNAGVRLLRSSNSLDAIKLNVQAGAIRLVLCRGANKMLITGSLTERMQLYNYYGLYFKLLVITIHTQGLHTLYG